MKLTELQSHITTWNINGQRVLVRAELNVPLEGKKIVSDYRLQQLQPTLDTIIRRGGKIILMTHIGRPEQYDANLSTKILIPWFEKQGYKIAFIKDLAQAYDESFEQMDHILLLDNLRFYPGEKDHDTEFVQSLAQLGDFYVNDAFGSMHRDDSSIALVPYEFKKSHRTIGLLVEKELKHLNALLQHPQKPFVTILGGGKLADKIPLIDSLLDRIQILLLGPAIATTFLYAQGKPVGKSLIDTSLTDVCLKLLDKAQKKGVTVLLPEDFLIALNSLEGTLKTVSANDIPLNGIAISIGARTITTWSKLLHSAGTVFQNGLMGFAQRPETTQGMVTLLQAMAHSKAYSLVGGGDSVAVAIEHNLEHRLSALSTGGGATLAYLAGQELPGLKPFSN